MLLATLCFQDSKTIPTDESGKKNLNNRKEADLSFIYHDNNSEERIKNYLSRRMICLVW